MSKRMTIEEARIAHCNARIFVLEQQLLNAKHLTFQEFIAIGTKINILENKIDCANGQIKAKVKMSVTKGEDLPSKINWLKFEV